MTAAIDTLIYSPRSEDDRRIDDPRVALSTAELAECTCPDWCERDHDRD